MNNGTIEQNTRTKEGELALKESPSSVPSLKGTHSDSRRSGGLPLKRFETNLDGFKKVGRLHKARKF